MKRYTPRNCLIFCAGMKNKYLETVRFLPAYVRFMLRVSPKIVPSRFIPTYVRFMSEKSPLAVQ